LATLFFPENAAIGVVEWQDRLIEARGQVEIPDGVQAKLTIGYVDDFKESDGLRSWKTLRDPMSLKFLEKFAPDVFFSVVIDVPILPEHRNNLLVLRGITHLYLYMSLLDDNFLKVVRRLPNLSWLQTCGNRFSPRGLFELSGHESLEYLYFEEDNIPLDWVEVLPLLPKLKRVLVGTTPIDPSVVEELEQNFPSLEVITVNE
jgi:hypothetical protein